MFDESVDRPEAGAAIVQTASTASGGSTQVSNAGIGSYGSFEDLTVAQWRLMLQVHLDGAFHVCQPAYRVMKDQGYARLVLVVFERRCVRGFRQRGLWRCEGRDDRPLNALSVEGAEYGITVKTTLPFGFTRRVTARAGKQVSERQQQFYDSIAPEKVVPMVVYLCRRDWSVTHHNFSAGAGRYASAFMGLTKGWYDDSDDPVATAEEITGHLDDITTQEGFTTPMTIRKRRSA